MIYFNKKSRYMEKNFNKESKKFIKQIMIEKDISFVDLTKLLNEKGFEYSEAAVRQKVTRGRFDFAFALQICEVLECSLEVKYSYVLN